MDMTHNRIPDPLRSIHLIAVCGTAMGALACMLKDMGYEVTGSDQKVYPPMSTYLEERGIEIKNGFDGENLAHKPDLVVVGNAVTRDNTESAELREMGLHFCSMPQALNHFAARGKKTLVVIGTHGKTTTSSIMAWVLECAGLDPSFMVGGILKNFNSNYRLGHGGTIVLEGDEYDTAFFDKGPKFLHFAPAIAVLTSVEFDHADIFEDLDHVKRTFGRFVDAMSPKSTLLAHDSSGIIDDLVRTCPAGVERYGRKKGSAWRLGTTSLDPPWTVFEVFKNGSSYGKFRTRMVGEHNLMNILSVIGTADRLSVPPAVTATALESFEGVKRRQEIRGTRNGITVMDDFAHHPTAVLETLKGVRGAYPHRRLVAVFEPRTNTSMRDVFQDIYPRTFDPADIICIRNPSLLSKVPQGMRFSSEKLVDDLRGRGKDAHFFPDTVAIVDFLTKTAKPGDLILVMSNGGFDNIHERLLESL